MAARAERRGVIFSSAGRNEGINTSSLVGSLSASPASSLCVSEGCCSEGCCSHSFSIHPLELLTHSASSGSFSAKIKFLDTPILRFTASKNRMALGPSSKPTKVTFFDFGSSLDSLTPSFRTHTSDPNSRR